MADYRALRERYALLELCRTPELATEDHAAAGRRHRRRRRHHLLGPAAAARADGAAVRLREGRRPAGRAAAPERRRHRPAQRCSSRARGSAYVLEAIAMTRQRARRTRAADRLRRRAVHAGVVRHRGRPVARLRPDQGADVRPPRGLAPALRPAGAASSATSSSPRSRPARRPSRSSTRGSARCRPRTTASSRCPTPRAIFAALEPTGVPTIHFGTGTSTILPTWPRPAATSSASTGASRSTTAWQRIGDRPRRPGQPRSDAAARPAPPPAARRRRRPATRRRPARPHLQPRPRHPAGHARSSTCRRSRGSSTAIVSRSERAWPPTPVRSPWTSPWSAAGSPV